MGTRSPCARRVGNTKQKPSASMPSARFTSGRAIDGFTFGAISDNPFGLGKALSSSGVFGSGSVKSASFVGPCVSSVVSGYELFEAPLS